MTDRDDYRDVGGTSPKRNEVESRLERRQTQGFEQGSSYVAEPKDGRERLSCRNRAGYTFERGIMSHFPVRHPFGASISTAMLFKIVPDDFVEPKGSHQRLPAPDKTKGSH